MPLFPEDLKEKEVVVNREKIYTIEVHHCSQCPFSCEIINEIGDYLGNNCEISECKSRLTDEEIIPKECPLKKNKKTIIDVVLKRD